MPIVIAGKEVVSNLPTWRGAERIYTRAYKVLDEMSCGGGITKNSKGQCIVSQEMEEVIDALASGDEERIKGLLLQYNTAQVVGR